MSRRDRETGVAALGMGKPLVRWNGLVGHVYVLLTQLLSFFWAEPLIFLWAPFFHSQPCPSGVGSQNSEVWPRKAFSPQALGLQEEHGSIRDFC